MSANVLSYRSFKKMIIEVDLECGTVDVKPRGAELLEGMMMYLVCSQEGDTWNVAVHLSNPYSEKDDHIEISLHEECSIKELLLFFKNLNVPAHVLIEGHPNDVVAGIVVCGIAWMSDFEVAVEIENDDVIFEVNFNQKGPQLVGHADYSKVGKFLYFTDEQEMEEEFSESG